MIFWTLVTIVAIITVITVINSVLDNWNSLIDHVMFGFMSLFVGSVVGGLIFLGCAFLLPTERNLVADGTYKLKAIGNSNATEGRMYFLGGGYVNDKRVLNFISQRSDGGIKVEQADAEDATVFEGSADATVQVKHYDHNNGWVATWPLGSSDEYTFRIPTGSVVESYTFDNK